MHPVCGSLIVLLFLIVSLAGQAAETADIILVGGKIVTVDDRFTIGQAVAIKGQRISAVGSNAEIRKHTGAGTRVIELKGATVIPGLIDNHSHWIRRSEERRVGKGEKMRGQRREL